jgi:DNA-binding MarR family transcriptional regulator
MPMVVHTKKPRQELRRRLGMDLGRELSAHTVFFHELVAQKLGLNATDTRCLDLVVRATDREITAGDLGRATGLTTGAITGILDRLEKADLVHRIRDANDRRRVIVRARPEATSRVAELYEGLGAAMMKLVSGYSATELELIGSFLERNLAILKEQIARLS